MSDQKNFECLSCGKETTMEAAQEPRGVEMYLRCAHCGAVMSDQEYSRARLLRRETDEG